MPCWYYEKNELEDTPSTKDGINYETECQYRKEGVRFIIDTGSMMKLGCNTVATGAVYFHRFYMFHSFTQFPRYVTACCCLFLAGKVEETPKKCRDIIKTAKELLTDEQFHTFGDDPKNAVMTLEKILLQTILFDLQVEHPYSYLFQYAKCLKGDKDKLQKMVQMAWTFVNDSLCTTLPLQWEPEIIAVALMYLAGKLSTFEVVDWDGRQPKHLRWWDMFVEDVTMDLLEDICHQVLDLYSPANNADSGDSLSASTPSQTQPKPTPSPAIPAAEINFSNAFTSNKQMTGESTPAVNACQPMDLVEENAGPVEVLPQYLTYPGNYPPVPTPPYPTIFPPANLSVPPPQVNPINHIASGQLPLFPLYGYQPNVPYYPAGNQPTNLPRQYYNR